ncbi:Non-canonical purine NTP phosphatase [Colletotrichum spinosum]|uniref:inosine/xanthosine triphosphatase n=1 Tax=Colletotrichum spinosum TaxID=1347390 RepID=A0A4R8PS39_9PEZI|nr:Non-canonical purine NTP phosphatase [Colletotrichum spinosum]
MATDRPLVIVVSSKNPVKINATKAGFELASIGPGLYEFKGVSVPSGVPEQPTSDQETLLGAVNRVRNARQAETDADYWVGIEGGVEAQEHQQGALMNFAWVVVADREGKVGKARTAAYYLPEESARHVRQGMELGHADDLVFGEVNSKQTRGSVGLLTGDLIDRTTYYSHAMVLALIPFRAENGNLTFV